MRRIIREEEPPQPSTRLSTLGETRTTVSANRRPTPRHLDRTVRGELDWIVMKALEKDRRRRYETANDFASDVMRYLTDQPVEACPPSTWYRVRKSARRNRVALTTAAIVSIALMVARRSASGRRSVRPAPSDRRISAYQIAEDAVHEYLVHVTADEELNHPNLAPLKKRLVEAAAPFYQKLSDQGPPSPTGKADRARALHRLGHIREDAGDHVKAREEYERAALGSRPSHPSTRESPIIDVSSQKRSTAWGTATSRPAPETRHGRGTSWSFRSVKGSSPSRRTMRSPGLSSRRFT